MTTRDRVLDAAVHAHRRRRLGARHDGPGRRGGRRQPADRAHRGRHQDRAGRGDDPARARAVPRPSSTTPSTSTPTTSSAPSAAPPSGCSSTPTTTCCSRRWCRPPTAPTPSCCRCSPPTASRCWAWPSRWWPPASSATTSCSTPSALDAAIDMVVRVVLSHVMAAERPTRPHRRRPGVDRRAGAQRSLSVPSARAFAFATASRNARTTYGRHLEPAAVGPEQVALDAGDLEQEVVEPLGDAEGGHHVAEVGVLAVVVDADRSVRHRPQPAHQPALPGRELGPEPLGRDPVERVVPGLLPADRRDHARGEVGLAERRAGRRGAGCRRAPRSARWTCR